MSTWFNRPPNRERRVKFFVASQSDVFALLTHRHLDCGNYLQVESLAGVPDGCLVESVHYEPASLAFYFCVYHPTFPLITEGALIPVANDLLSGETRCYRIGEEIACATVTGNFADPVAESSAGRPCTCDNATILSHGCQCGGN